MKKKSADAAEGKARRAFATAMKEQAARQPDHGNTKMIGSSKGSWSMNDIAGEIEKGTKRGKEFYGQLKDVLKFPAKKP